MQFAPKHKCQDFSGAKFQEFLYVRKIGFFHETSTTIDTAYLQKAKEESPLAGSNRGPQDHKLCDWLHQLQSCALPAELRRVDGNGANIVYRYATGIGFHEHLIPRT